MAHLVLSEKASGTLTSRRPICSGSRLSTTCPRYLPNNLILILNLRHAAKLDHTVQASPLHWIVASGFRCRYSLQELSTVKLQKACARRRVPCREKRYLSALRSEQAAI